MNKKMITTTAIAGILLLLLAVLPASAAIQATSVEIRGTVYNESAPVFSWDANDFAGFWYDLKKNMKSETLEITDAGVIAGLGDRTIDEDELTYTAERKLKEYKVSSSGNGNVTDGLDSTGTSVTDGTHYAVVGWQAEKYIALNGNAKKLVKQVLEQGSTDTKTLTIGETWDIGDGWTLMAQSIDAKASPRQAWLVLSKDGVKLDDKVIKDSEVFTKCL
ncbi:MAG: hypothetical protein AEth_00990 [Candidatus Argoarchaeum ethanivorans]|uniref:S-layer family duplication domain-containing protein n=1 Tax=Candidatus Argoarchaeum ethanivorans TaxID=2608793 RepID=A0A8B3S275_9EURY|nr:MAG: hypothetical protein AEth_00990 [Candidatus Argoarchaeum ethanivorans]